MVAVLITATQRFFILFEKNKIVFIIVMIKRLND